MSRIDELIRRLVPRGVPRQAIREVAEVSAGATPASGRPEYWDGGTIPWMSSGEVNLGTVFDTDQKITQAGYESCSTKLLPPNIVVMALAGQGKTRGLVARTRVSLCTNQSLAAIVPNDSVSADYLYHFLSTQYKQLRSISAGDGTRGGLNLKIIREYKVPVPPLEVQAEIVRILDAFAELQAELDAELQAELEARRLQYSFHREQLVTFPEDGKVRTVTLPDISRNLDSRRRPVTKAARDAGGYPYYGASGVVDHVSEYIFDGEYLLISEDGANLLARSTPIAFSISGKTWVNNHAHILEFDSSVEQRFVEMYLNSIDLTPYITGEAQPKLNQANLNKIPIPRPAPDRQSQIVEVLNRLDGLEHELEVSLSAELGARRRQYEYYRERLLTFEEAMT